MSLLRISILGCLFANVAPLSAQVSINFSYSGSGGFLDASEGAARRAALEAAAHSLSGYFIDGPSVNLTFAVDSYSADNGTLASASSPIYFSSEDTGFFQTVVQKKITGGPDDNNAASDGNVNWNWHYDWSLSGAVGEEQFDLATTAKHELLHAMGFASMVSEPGTNNGRLQWTVFDSYLVDVNGNALISSTGSWLGRDSALTNGGLFFGGANAVAANGGFLVPLYSPASWEAGSSGSHLDISGDWLIMNAYINPGEGPDALSAIELGMLQDLGYDVSAIPEPGSVLFLLGGGVIFLRRRKR